MTPEPLEEMLTGADDRLRLNHWMPPQAGIVPRIRIGRRWVSILWGLPIGAAALLRRNLLIYGVGGIIAPFVGIKLIDMLVVTIGLA